MNREPALTLDLRGLACPFVVTELTKALKKTERGCILELLLEADQIDDVTAFCEVVGCELLETQKGETIRILLRR